MIYFVKIFVALSFLLGDVSQNNMSIEERAIASCESGNGLSLESLDWNAVNYNKNGTIDTGAFQFNSYWIWNPEDAWFMKQVIAHTDLSIKQFFILYPNAKDAPVDIQRLTFEILWDNGHGWQHWSASRPCWSKWLKVNKQGVAVPRRAYLP
jgi:hypothetical protein